MGDEVGESCGHWEEGYRDEERRGDSELEKVPSLTVRRVYTKRRGEQPDLTDPICLRQGATIETVCHGIHRSLASHFKWVGCCFRIRVHLSDRTFGEGPTAMTKPLADYSIL